jgi:hypothetical protein
MFFLQQNWRRRGQNWLSPVVGRLQVREDSEVPQLLSYTTTALRDAICIVMVRKCACVCVHIGTHTYFLQEYRQPETFQD